ncbi:ribonuclease T2-like isoform X3 [Chiloscyllium plagiosum]|uniref:ribonuclease T2-like isoform X3 n=1 Tax=Chiloscyllium plagiosum TaxID=36176 RepID=UPI001CB7FD69|nr:ribonuclease T2-like isoform X3 [Chiloscyllium plagiosum]
MACRNSRENKRNCTFVRIFLPLIIAIAFLQTSDCKNHQWHSLSLSHHWPQTVCLMESETCKVPQNIDYWTVHGLWPKGDELCNKSWHFEIQNVKDILPELKLWWPDVLHPNSTQFWKHEWAKHGTCAATLQSLNTQEKYFSKTLDLFHKTDLNSWRSLKVHSCQSMGLCRKFSALSQREDQLKSWVRLNCVSPKTSTC